VTAITIILVIFSLLCLCALLVMWGVMIGMRIMCEIWAPQETYENLYGPKGTIQPGWLETKVFKILRRP